MMPEYAATVYLKETEPLAAKIKAQEVYDFLGPEFFCDNPRDREVTIAWLSRLLINDDLRVDFHDANDAMLFKLKFY
jgi:hypothetical protein